MLQLFSLFDFTFFPLFFSFILLLSFWDFADLLFAFFRFFCICLVFFGNLLILRISYGLVNIILDKIRTCPDVWVPCVVSKMHALMFQSKNSIQEVVCMKGSLESTVVRDVRGLTCGWQGSFTRR